jgi:hypothetical protein
MKYIGHETGDETMAKNTERAKGAKRGPGRPPSTGPKKEPIFTGLLPDVVERLDAEAARENRSRAAMVAILVEEALQAREKSK